MHFFFPFHSVSKHSRVIYAVIDLGNISSSKVPMHSRFLKRNFSIFKRINGGELRPTTNFWFFIALGAEKKRRFFCCLALHEKEIFRR